MPIGLDVPIAASLSLVVLLVHLIIINQYGIFRDELYYIACGEHLAFGYVDHPPFIALVAFVARRLLGDSLLAIRFFPAVASSLVVFVCLAIARELGGRRTAQAITGVAVITGTTFLLAGHILSTIIFDMLWSALAIYLFVRTVNTGGAKLFVWLGAVLGIGLMTKHNMAFVAVAIAAVIAADGMRAMFFARAETLPHAWLIAWTRANIGWLAAGALLAIVIFLPHIVWQATHDWPTLGFMRGLRRGLAGTTYTGMAREFALGVNPMTLPLAAAGLVFLFATRTGRRYAAVGWVSVIVIGIIVATRGKSYYMIPAYFPLLAAGAVWFERWGGPRAEARGLRDVAEAGSQAPGEPRAEARGLRDVRVAATIALLLAGGVALAPFGLPVLTPDRLVAYEARFGLTRWGNFAGGSQALPAHFADMFGWPELVDDVARAYAALPGADRRDAIIYAHNFGEAAAIDFFGPARGLPGAYSGNHNYYFWPPPGDARVILAVGEAVEDMQQTCGDVEVLPRHKSHWAVSVETSVPICICRGLRAPLSQIWPRVRSGF